MGNTNSDANNNLLSTYFVRRALPTLQAETFLYQIAQKEPLPKGEGKTMVWNAWREIAGASSTLSEYSASANAMVTLSSRKVSATIASYGRGIQFSDFIDLTSSLPVHPGALARLEDSAAKTVEAISQIAAFKNNILHANNSGRGMSAYLSAWMSAKASVFCADTGTVADNAATTYAFGFPVVFATSCQKLSAMHAASAKVTNMSAAFGPFGVNKAVTRLKKLNVKPMANGKYAGIIHPYAVGTMYMNPDFKTWKQGFEEGVKESLYKHAVGTMHNVDFMESSLMPRYEGSLNDNKAKNLNLTFICGIGAFGFSELDGGLSFIYHDKTQTADAFELKATLTYKIRAAGAVLNPSCGVILISQDMMAPVTTVA